MAIKLYPLGIQTFERIREEDKLYIDKTEYIYRMAHTNGESRYWFPPLKTILRERETCSKDLPSKIWRKNGQNILCCILT